MILLDHMRIISALDPNILLNATQYSEPDQPQYCKPSTTTYDL